MTSRSALAAHYQSIHSSSLLSLFKENPARATQFSTEAGGLWLDYSKNHITDETIALLLPCLLYTSPSPRDS